MAVLDTDIQDTLSALLQGDPSPRAHLASAVCGHLDQVRGAALTSAFVDLATAERVAGGWLELLAAYDTLPNDHRRWVSAGCRYFAEVQDGEADLVSVVGFDDDLEVLEHVLHHLGRR